MIMNASLLNCVSLFDDNFCLFSFVLIIKYENIKIIDDINTYNTLAKRVSPKYFPPS